MPAGPCASASRYLKQMGERSLDRIEEERRHGPFESFEDFYLRTRID